MYLETLQDIRDALSPDPTWPDAKCGECGYWFERSEMKHLEGGTSYSEIVGWGCGRTGICLDPRHRALPCFVRRPAQQAEGNGGGE